MGGVGGRRVPEGPVRNPLAKKGRVPEDQEHAPTRQGIRLGAEVAASRPGIGFDDREATPACAIMALPRGGWKPAHSRVELTARIGSGRKPAPCEQDSLRRKEGQDHLAFLADQAHKAMGLTYLFPREIRLSHNHRPDGDVLNSCLGFRHSQRLHVED
jgi:hypothetical protein